MSDEQQLSAGAFADIAVMGTDEGLIVCEDTSRRAWRLFDERLIERVRYQPPTGDFVLYPRIAANATRCAVAWQDGDYPAAMWMFPERGTVRLFTEDGGCFGPESVCVSWNGARWVLAYIVQQTNRAVVLVRRWFTNDGQQTQIVIERTDTTQGISRILPDDSVVLVDQDRSDPRYPGISRPYVSPDSTIACGEGNDEPARAIVYVDGARRLLMAGIAYRPRFIFANRVYTFVAVGDRVLRILQLTRSQLEALSLDAPSEPLPVPTPTPVPTPGPIPMPYSRQSPDYSGEIAKLAREFPKEWADAHRFELGDRAYRFIKIAGWRLNQKDPRIGLNGKRGNPNDLSADALAYKNATSPWGAEVIDCIQGAGGSDPRPVWNDVTQDTIAGGAVGVFVQPRDPGGTGPTPQPTPAPTPQPQPAPVPAPTPQPAPAPIPPQPEEEETMQLHDVSIKEQQRDDALNALRERPPYRDRPGAEKLDLVAVSDWYANAYVQARTLLAQTEDHRWPNDQEIDTVNSRAHGIAKQYMVLYLEGRHAEANDILRPFLTPRKK